MLSEVAKIVGAAPPQIPVIKNGAEPKKRAAVHNSTKHAADMGRESAVCGLNIQPALSLGLAKEIAYCIERCAQQMEVSVVTAVTDGRGRLILLEAMDDSFIASIDAARDKAYTAAALKMPTHEALKESRGGALDGYTNGNGILMLGGGYPLMYSGRAAGAVGVSGGTKEQDIILAKTGKEYFEKRIQSL